MIKNLNFEFKGNKNSTVVFLHGWGMSGESFDKVINLLPDDQRILKLDFFSFGKSEEMEDWYDTYEVAYQIFLLINELKIDDVILVGHSFGGRIAIILSSIFGINVKSVILASSAGINRFSLLKFIKIKWYKFIKFLVTKKMISNKTLLNYGSDNYQKLDNKNKKIFVRIVNQDLRHLLYKIDQQVDLVWDKKDDITPYYICKILYKTLMCPNIILFKNGKHYSYLYNINKFSNIIIKHINN